jgi:hypothetical protein
MRFWRSSLFRSFVYGDRVLYADRFAATAERSSTETPSAPQPDASSTRGPVHGRLALADWARIVPGSTHYIQSYLVDHPDKYYMAPNRQFIYILTRRSGLVEVRQDWRNVPDERVGAYVAYLRGMLE